MSIAELITSIANKVKGIKDNVLAAYDVVASKNGEVPSEKTMENLPNAIASTHDTLEELTITQNGEYTPQEGVDGFSKVIANVVPSRKVVIPNNMKVTKALIVDGYWAGELVDTRFMTSMLDMFYGCNTLQQLDVSGWDTSNVTNMSFIFADCSQLQLLDVSNWDVSDVTNMSYMFRNCTSLQQLDVSNWDVSNVTNFSFMLSSCTNLQWIDTTNWDLSIATNIGYTFRECDILTSMIGNRTIEDVIANNISALKGLNINVPSTTFLNSPNIDRASLRAIINGLADRTGQNALTLTLGATLIAKLTEEDIAIGVNKNWTIV